MQFNGDENHHESIRDDVVGFLQTTDNEGPGFVLDEAYLARVAKIGAEASQTEIYAASRHFNINIYYVSTHDSQFHHYKANSSTVEMVVRREGDYYMRKSDPLTEEEKQVYGF